MTVSKGWTLLFHDALVGQLQRLCAAVEKANKKNPESSASNANVLLFSALSKLILETIPDNPNRDEYRQGKTLGSEFKHWRRAKIGRRFRLFFRFDTQSQIIIFAWVNDENTLRNPGGKSDPYAVFKRMLDRGCPPDSWDDLLSESKPHWQTKDKPP